MEETKHSDATTSPMTLSALLDALALINVGAAPGATDLLSTFQQDEPSFDDNGGHG